MASDLDEPMLRRIAGRTGGRFFRASDADTLEEVYRTIDRLEKTEIRVKTYREYSDRFAWFLFPALAFLGLETVLAQTRSRSLP